MKTKKSIRTKKIAKKTDLAKILKDIHALDAKAPSHLKIAKKFIKNNYGEPPPYKPCFDSWAHDRQGLHVFEIASKLLPIGKYSPTIATITIDPAFNAEEAEQIAMLISEAPTLYQMLRQTLTLIDTSKHLELFRKSMESLWESFGQHPFLPPKSDADRDNKNARNTMARVALLTDARKKAKKKPASK